MLCIADCEEHRLLIMTVYFVQHSVYKIFAVLCRVVEAHHRVVPIFARLRLLTYHHESLPPPTNILYIPQTRDISQHQQLPQQH